MGEYPYTVVAAPESPIILSENADVRVLKIVIKPNHKEPFHILRWSRIFIMLQPAGIRYCDSAGVVTYETASSGSDLHNFMRSLIAKQEEPEREFCEQG